MRIIGLTGSIACGKSTLSHAIREAGWPVIDGDALSRECTAPGGPALPAIRTAFGGGVFFPDGQLDRKKLGNLVFSDPEAMEKLNRLMAPLLRALTEQRLAEVRLSGAALCFLEMPLLFEQGYDAMCDTVWCVWIPEDLQIRRLTARDGISRAQAMERIAAVLPSDEKAARSQVVLDNSGAPEEMLARLPELLAEEVRLAGPRRRRSARYEDAPAAPAAENVPPARPTAAASAPAPGPETPARPSVSGETIERPSAMRKQASTRKVAWRLPSWLMVALICFGSALALAFTAQCLMSAYLTRRHEQHTAEQQAIDANYPIAYRDLIEEYAGKYNLRPAFVAAIIRNESSFRPTAESSVGARGLMQLMPDTAEWIAHKLKISGYAFERMYDPESNILFGCWYLNYLCTLFQGDPVAVTCAYHAGQGEITAWLSNSRYTEGGRLTLDRLPEGPTKQYAGRVTRDDGIYEVKYFSPMPVLPADGDTDPQLP